MTRFALPRPLPRAIVAAPKPAAPAPVQLPPTLTEEVEFDEDGRRILTSPIAAPARPVPTIMPPPASRLPRPVVKPMSPPPAAFVAAMEARRLAAPIAAPAPIAPAPSVAAVSPRPAPAPAPVLTPAPYTSSYAGPGLPPRAPAPYVRPKPAIDLPVAAKSPSYIAPVTPRVPPPPKAPPKPHALTFTADDVPF